MKNRYYRTIGQRKEFLEKNFVIVDGVRIFNPSEEQILAAGWAIWEEPAPTEEEIVEAARKSLMAAIMEYDASENVNRFYLGSSQMWLDAATRSILRLSVEAYKAEGKKKVTKVWQGQEYAFAPSVWLSMLNKVEMYASECMNVTQRHIAQAASLEGLEAIQGYDYRTGYPEPVTFTTEEPA